jgi:ATP-dependent Clp protease ATP-binding subunit ClpC
MAERPGSNPLEELVLGLVEGLGRLDQGMNDWAGRAHGDRPEPDRGAGREADRDDRREPPTPPRRPTRTLDRYGRDLTAEARAGTLDPVIGRDQEIAQVLEVLSRRSKNNPVLLGDPGVGKTAIAEGIASRIVDGDVPDSLRGRRLVSLDLSALVAGTRYRGDFEQRMTAVVDEVMANERGVVLFLDELHTLIGAGSAEGAPMDAANILKPALAKGGLQVIGATTQEEYRTHIERDAALERRFQPIQVDEPSVPDTIAILRGLAPRYESHHRVVITDSAAEAAALLSDRYLTDRFLPDKAIDLIDRAGARVRMRAQSPTGAATGRSADRSAGEPATDPTTPRPTGRRISVGADGVTEVGEPPTGAGRTDGVVEVTAEDVAQVVADITGIPVSRLTQLDRQRLLLLEELLAERVVGQADAVAAVADAVRAGRAGLTHPGRPVGSLLFLGPTGVGKTELARALAATLFGDADRLVRLDMTEYGDRHTVSRLVGAPPGYIGHDEAGQLTEPVRRRPYTVVLLDEIEKAHPEVLNLLLQVLDDGRLTDSRGRTANFTHAVIIMTSNLGAEELLAATAAGHPTETVREPLMDRVRAHFRPEFLNRLDEIVLFRGLGPEELRAITQLLLTQTSERLRAQNIELVVEPAAVDWLARRGHQPEFGARPLRRTLARELERRLSRMLLADELTPGQRVTVTVSGVGDSGDKTGGDGGQLELTTGPAR